MADEEKTFYPFKIGLDENKRAERIKKLGNKYPLSKILEFLEVNESDDEIENKIRNALHQELQAIGDAVKDDNFKREEVYKSNRKGKDGKDIPNTEGKIPEISEFFAAEDDFLKNHADDYSSYQIKRQELEDNQAPDGDIKQLELDYEKTLNAFKRCEAAQEGFDNLYGSENNGDLVFLERNPKKVNQSLLNFYKDCKAAGKEDDFNEMYQDFFADRYFNARHVPNEKGEPTAVIENEHRFSLGKDGRTTHSILNLKNSGLDISWVDGKFGLAHCPENLSEAQIRALAEYCYANGINIDDYFKLNDLKVINNKGEEIGSAAAELDKTMKQFEENGGDIRGSQQTKADEVVDFSEMLGRTAEVAADITDFTPQLKGLDVTRKKMVGATKNRIGLMGFSNEDLYSISKGWNSTTISVYKTENDRLKDGETDKNGNRAHTKEFAIELTHTMPPHARLYIEQGKEVKADHLRLALDAFKAAGCKYFIVPPAPVMGGKAVMGAAMQASVKSGLVPVCKRSKNSKGCYLGEPDLVAIQKALDEEPMDTDAKTEYLIRLVREIKAQEAGKLKENPKYETSSSISSSMAKFEYVAKFGKFQSSYMEKLQDFVNDGLAGKYGEKWDEIDRAAALKAMKHIAEDMEKGKLNGKPYNPVDRKGENLKEMKKAMAFYMAAEKPQIVELIHKRIVQSSGDVKDSKITSTVRGVCSEIEQDVCNKYFGERMKANGIEGLKPSINSADVKYTPSNYIHLDANLDDVNEDDNRRNSQIMRLYRDGKEKDVQPPSLPNDELKLNDIAKQAKQYFKDQAEVKKRGGKVATFDEYRRKRSYEIG